MGRLVAIARMGRAIMGDQYTGVRTGPIITALIETARVIRAAVIAKTVRTIDPVTGIALRGMAAFPVVQDAEEIHDGDPQTEYGERYVEGE